MYMSGACRLEISIYMCNALFCFGLLFLIDFSLWYAAPDYGLHVRLYIHVHVYMYMYVHNIIIHVHVHVC